LSKLINIVLKFQIAGNIVNMETCNQVIRDGKAGSVFKFISVAIETAMGDMSISDNGRQKTCIEMILKNTILLCCSENKTIHS